MHLTLETLVVAQQQLVKTFPALVRLVEEVKSPPIAPPVPDPSPGLAAFQELVQAIIHQQLSIKAGATITGRLIDLVQGRVEPAILLEQDTTGLRAIGLSGQKVGYIKSLAEHVLADEEGFDRLYQLPDAEVIKKLTAVKGIGEWTAQMYLIFQLWRPDVWPTKDLGVVKGAAVLMGLDQNPTEQALQQLAEPMAGHRTVMAWYMWRLYQHPELLLR